MRRLANKKNRVAFLRKPIPAIRGGKVFGQELRFLEEASAELAELQQAVVTGRVRQDKVEDLVSYLIEEMNTLKQRALRTGENP